MKTKKSKSDDPIKWTKGTDKTETEAIRGWWSDELGESPGEDELIRLEQEIMKRKKRIDDAKASYQGNDDKTERFIIMEERIVNALEDLLSSYKSVDNELIKLINNFVQKFEAEKNEQLIKDYLITWEGFKGLSYPRAKAKKELKSSYPELTKIADGTLSNWENKWVKYRDPRTEN